MAIAKDDNLFTEMIIVLLKTQMTISASHCYQNGHICLNWNWGRCWQKCSYDLMQFYEVHSHSTASSV